MKIQNATKNEPISLSEQVYKKVRMAIIKGEIPDGSRLVESTLARELNMSRTPVRDALQRLVQEGLVTPVPRIGYLVEEMSEEDIEDLFATRMIIEQLAAQWALTKITALEIERIEKNILKTDEVLRTGATEKMIDLDREFHNLVCKASRSKRLYQISKTLSDHTLKFRIACIHIPEIASRAREGHYRIFRAIRSKDNKQVEEAVQYHLKVTKRDILDFLRNIKQEKFLAQELDL